MFMYSSTLIMVTTREMIILSCVFRISAVIIIMRVSTKATLSEIVPVSILENSFGFHIDVSQTRRHSQERRMSDKLKMISDKFLITNKLQINCTKY